MKHTTAVRSGQHLWPLLPHPARPCDLKKEEKKHSQTVDRRNIERPYDCGMMCDQSIRFEGLRFVDYFFNRTVLRVATVVVTKVMATIRQSYDSWVKFREVTARRPCGSHKGVVGPPQGRRKVVALQGYPAVFVRLPCDGLPFLPVLAA